MKTAPKMIAVLTLGLMQALTTLAKDFEMKSLPERANDHTYALPKACNGGTYYDFMQETGYTGMQETFTRLPNEKALAAGEGMSVKLNASNYNIHINYPNSPQGGRSYGWTDGQVGDWSDKMYLDNLAEVMTSDDANLRAFYEVTLRLLGTCSPKGLSGLDNTSQRVATNFLAIYTAEQYRAIVGSHNWDDALFQVTLLAAFHGGQDRLTKFYAGVFTDRAHDQSACAYQTGETDAKFRAARLNDYWQFGRTATIGSSGRCTGRSGINITRRDFQALGKAITKYYASEDAGNKTLQAIEAVVGKSSNVFAAISEYFVKGKAQTSETDALAKNVAKFLIQVRNDANDITNWTLHQEGA